MSPNGVKALTDLELACRMAETIFGGYKAAEVYANKNERESWPNWPLKNIYCDRVIADLKHPVEKEKFKGHNLFTLHAKTIKEARKEADRLNRKRGPDPPTSNPRPFFQRNQAGQAQAGPSNNPKIPSTIKFRVQPKNEAE